MAAVTEIDAFTFISNDNESSNGALLPVMGVITKWMHFSVMPFCRLHLKHLIKQHGLAGV